MYVSSRKSIDMKIHIIKYEEGFFIDSVKVDYRKDYNNCNLYDNLYLNRKLKKCNWLSTSFKWQKGQIRRFSGVFGSAYPPVSICKRWMPSLNLFSVFARNDVVSQRLKFGRAFLSSSWESKITLFF